MHFVLGSVVKDDCCAGTVKGQKSVDLFIERSPNELILVEGPDGKYASYCEVGINDGRAIERVISDNVLMGGFLCLFSGDLIELRALLTGKSYDLRVIPEMLFNNLIAMDILMKLLVSELVLGFELDDGGVFENGGNLLD